MNLHTVQAPQGDLRASPEKLAYTVPEALYATGLGRTTLYALIAERKLRMIKVGSRTLIPADSLRSYLASLEMEAA
ncbi:helix-turn-helix domain-containing protein [Methylobacterium sp. E-016]|uniref:helix-turn-helix domain-containing protein n=1 Tax=Methylobacterium sp. E-016 TaxID=2836556 RepID=UPI001FBAC815|nr:helix-turn-helix domain-containing protein [Methylobacterium sp. E-016]MCJ2077902.1 helix-turn-helix domain-containing protein [Methylobacterium sp. E-016]